MSIHIYRRYASGIAFSGVASAAKALGNLVLLVMLSKAVGSEGYGVWAQIITTISLLMPIAFLQLGASMVRFLAAEKDKRVLSSGLYSVLAVVAGTGTLLSLLMLVLAEPFAATFLKGADAAPLIRLSAFLVLLTTLDQVVIEYFLALRQVRKYSVFMIAQVIGELALVAYLISTGTGLYGAVMALLIVRGLLFLAGLYIAKGQTVFVRPNTAILKSWLRFSVPLLPFSLCFWLMAVGDRYVIGYALGAADVGLYSAAYGLGSIVYLFYVPLNAVLFPAITYLFDNNMLQEVKMIAGYTLKFYLFLAIPVAFGLLVLAKPLLGIMTTEEFAQAYSIVPIVAFATVLFSCSFIFSELLLLFKDTRTVSAVFVGSALLNLVLNIVLVPRVGIIGAAITTLLTFIVHTAVLAAFSRRRIPFEVDLGFLGKCLAASILMSIAVWRLNPTGTVTTVASIVIGAGIYFGALVLMRGFKQNERAFVRDLLRKQAPSP